jgi:excinuclease ABC subunit A
MPDNFRGLERPDVDKIDGLSPVIAIEQKTTSKALVLPWVQLLKYMTSCVYFMHVPRIIVTIQERKWSAILTNKLNLIVEDFTGKRITI